jgi:hypothetical protein
MGSSYAAVHYGNDYRKGSLQAVLEIPPLYAEHRSLAITAFYMKRLCPSYSRYTELNP